MARIIIVGENSELQSAMSHHSISLNECRWELKPQRFHTSSWLLANTRLLQLLYILSPAQREPPEPASSSQRKRKKQYNSINSSKDSSH